MNKNNFRSFSLLFLVLGACAYPAQGEWEAVEKHFLIDGEVAEITSVPYEDCYTSLDTQSEESEGERICVERGFTFHVESIYESRFEATNDITVGQEIITETKTYSEELHTFTDGGNFEFVCTLTKKSGEKEFYCDFRTSLGYLSNTKILFREKEND